MLKLSLRGLLARPTRLILTTLAVALGVALVAGTYVFTDTINASFEKLFTASQRGTDVVVTPRETVALEEEDSAGPTLPAALLTRLEQVDGVDRAGGQAEGMVAVFGPDGKKLGTAAAPSFVFSLAPDPRFDEALEIVTGRRPTEAGEALLDAGSAEKNALGLGSSIDVQASGERERLTVVGTTRIAGVDSLGGTVAVTLTLPAAQALLGRPGRFDVIQIGAKDGVTPAELAPRIRAVAGRDVVVRTATAEAADQASTLRDDLGFLSTALLAFAGISLFVGAFLIYNTFAITVAQRSRELALLRAMGASRAQVMRSVLAEGAAIGALGAVVGLGLGVLAAGGLRALFSTVGVELPTTGTVIALRTVLVALGTGILVTLAAALAPALRATRVAPIAALQDAAAPSGRPPSRRLTLTALALTTIGVALICGGLFGGGEENTALSLMGAGSLATFLGVALLSPHLVPPLARVVGFPARRLGGLPGRLAAENAVRQPGRTAVTASALMIGVALVAFASIFAASARQTIQTLVKGNLDAQIVVQNQDGFSSYPAGALRRAATVDGVVVATGVRFATARLGDDDGQALSGVDPVELPKVAGVDTKAFATLTAPRSAVVSTEKAAELGLEAGDTLTLGAPSGRQVRLRVSALFEDVGQLTAPITVSLATLADDFGQQRDAFGLIGLKEGADPVAVRAAVAGALKGPFPVVEALTADEFVENQSGQVDQLLGLIYALLSLSVIVSLVGIVNTLVLAVRERTRELGLLRAIGTSRRQVRASVRWEALITALIGAVLGLVVGTILATLFTSPLEDFVLAVPLASLLTLLVVAGIAGVLAATWPARRAAKLDILAALAHE